MGRFAELLAHEGVEEDLVLRSTFGFMAFHGGNLEEGTDLVAAAAADAAGASLYAVRQPPPLRWHIPSIEISPGDSDALAAYLAHVDVVVAVHGFGRVEHRRQVLIGGGNRALAGHLADHLRAVLDDHVVVDDLDAIPTDLRGVHPRNPVNAARCGGAQLELPPLVRTHGPRWADLPDGVATPRTVALVDGLAAAARSWSASEG